MARASNIFRVFVSSTFSDLKAETGAGKVLIFDCEEGRLRAFRKVLDVALSRVGGGKMPEEIPDEVIEAVKRA